MEKITKYYINEFIHGREWSAREIDIKSPEELDPLKVDVETRRLTKFVFLEQSFIKDGEDLYTGKSKTISPVYSVGKRISLEEALSLCEKGSMTEEILTRQAERSPGVTFCKTDIGFLEVMEEDAITLEEYKETKKTLD